MWTEAAIETLRQLALEGKSASSIAAALGAPSRNAVIGKANRIGVSLPATCTLRRPSAAGEHEQAAAAGDRSHKWCFMEAGRCPRLPARRKPTWLFAEAEVGEMLKVGLKISAKAPADGRSAIQRARISSIAAFRRRRAAPIARDIAGWPISRRIRGSGTGSVTSPSSPWLPEAATVA